MITFLASVAVSSVVIGLWRQRGSVYWSSFAAVVGLEFALSWLTSSASNPGLASVVRVYALPTSAAYAVRPLLGAATPRSAALIAVPCAYLGILIAILAGAARMDGSPW